MPDTTDEGTTMETDGTEARPSSPVEIPVEDVEDVDDDEGGYDWRELNIVEDISHFCIVPTVDQLIKSHMHKAAGACRWLERDVIIWTDFELKKIKKSYRVDKEVVPWMHPTSGESKGTYTLFGHKIGSSESSFWGLAPALQTIEFESDSCLKELGCHLEKMETPFVKLDKKPWASTQTLISCVVMKHAQITRDPFAARLAAFTSL